MKLLWVQSFRKEIPLPGYSELSLYAESTFVKAKVVDMQKYVQYNFNE